MLKGYRQAIHEATGCKESDAVIIEAMMRDKHRTLDHLPKSYFDKEAKSSHFFLTGLRNEYATNPEAKTVLDYYVEEAELLT